MELAMKVGKRGLIISNHQNWHFSWPPENLTSNDHDCCGKSPAQRFLFSRDGHPEVGHFGRHFWPIFLLGNTFAVRFLLGLFEVDTLLRNKVPKQQAANELAGSKVGKVQSIREKVEFLHTLGPIPLSRISISNKLKGTTAKKKVVSM